MSQPTANIADEEWRKKLTPDQYRVLRQSATEPPFQNAFWNKHEDGTYTCAGCNTPLFKSEEKFDSGCGWPSFWESFDTKSITFVDDHSHGMHRTEVRCAVCDGHLGHLFDDGPEPTGKRFCINSLSLQFHPEEKE